MTTYSYILTCVRCGKKYVKMFYEPSCWLRPKDWFLMEDGWRCGCILKRKD